MVLTNLNDDTNYFIFNFSSISIGTNTDGSYYYDFEGAVAAYNYDNDPATDPMAVWGFPKPADICVDIRCDGAPGGSDSNKCFSWASYEASPYLDFVSVINAQQWYTPPMSDENYAEFENVNTGNLQIDQDLNVDQLKWTNCTSCCATNGPICTIGFVRASGVLHTDASLWNMQCMLRMRVTKYINADLTGDSEEMFSYFSFVPGATQEYDELSDPGVDIFPFVIDSPVFSGLPNPNGLNPTLLLPTYKSFTVDFAVMKVSNPYGTIRVSIPENLVELYAGG